MESEPQSRSTGETEQETGSNPKAFLLVYHMGHSSSNCLIGVGSYQGKAIFRARWADQGPLFRRHINHEDRNSSDRLETTKVDNKRSVGLGVRHNNFSMLSAAKVVCWQRHKQRPRRRTNSLDQAHFQLQDNDLFRIHVNEHFLDSIFRSILPNVHLVINSLCH